MTEPGPTPAPDLLDWHMPGDLTTSEAALRERQDLLVRELAVEQNSARLQTLSDELEAIQRRLEQRRNA